MNRDTGVVRLNIEAIRAFSDTVTIAHRHALAAEQAALKQWFEQGGLQRGLPPLSGEASLARSEHVHFENLKIAAGLELHLKARLLAHNYVLHKIDSKAVNYKLLANAQRDRPIRRDELLAIQPYHFDGKENYLPGITDLSLEFSLLTGKAAYRAALGLTDQQLAMMEHYRRRRNQVHFPGDRLKSPSTHVFPPPTIDLLVEFIDSEIVEGTNNLISQHGFSYKAITPFKNAA